MPFLYFILILCGPLGWIIAAIIYFGRKNAAEQARTRETIMAAAYISSGRTPPARPLPDMSRWSKRDSDAYLAANPQPAGAVTDLDRMADKARARPAAHKWEQREWS